jgi:hypothetical protein
MMLSHMMRCWLCRDYSKWVCKREQGSAGMFELKLFEFC